MKKINILLCSIIISASLFAQTIGVGFGYGESHYKTKDDKKFGAMPIVDLQFGPVIIGTSGLGYRHQFSEELILDFLVRPNGMELKSGDLKSPYSGVDDRKGQYEAGISLTYAIDTFAIQGEIFTDITDKIKGENFAVNMSNDFMITEQLIFTPSIGYRMLDKKYMNYYYGISSAEATKTGLKAISPKAGSIISFTADLTYFYTENLAFGVTESYELLSDEFKTDIVKDDKFLSIGAFIIYNW